MTRTIAPCAGRWILIRLSYIDSVAPDPTAETEMNLITHLHNTINHIYPQLDAVELRLTRPTHAQFGDYTSNIALLLAKSLQRAPREIAQQIREHLLSQSEIFNAEQGLISKIEVAGPGHLNFFMAAGFYQQVITQIQQQQHQYGQQTIGQGQTWHLEYVSANPTGPLHVGHGRGAAYGATVASLLTHMGYQVVQEYYVNDAGRQMNILTLSVWLRYLQTQGLSLPFPGNAYQGDYIRSIAEQLATDRLAAEHGNSLSLNQTQLHILRDLMDSMVNPDLADQLLDNCIEFCQQQLGEAQFQIIKRAALDAILGDIRQDLSEFGIEFDVWFSEQSLLQNGALARTIQALEDSGHTYRQDNALWFRSTSFGDDKDRVLVRDNGQPTYFASDVAYHLDKFQRGYTHLINIWGSDHHGYMCRIKAAMTALGEDASKLQIELVQFANLFKDGERLSMSTRSGEFVTLRELREDVGRDAARFYYVMRRCDQHMDFDLSLAKSQSKDNPVYYIQYAHARLCSVLTREPAPLNAADISLLTLPEERSLLNHLADYPDLLQRAALQLEPHLLVQFLHTLASDFHSYYNSCKILIEEAELRQSRLSLAVALRWVIKNGLTLLGVSAPEHM